MASVQALLATPAVTSLASLAPASQILSVASFNGLKAFPVLKQRPTVLRLVASSRRPLRSISATTLMERCGAAAAAAAMSSSAWSNAGHEIFVQGKQRRRSHVTRARNVSPGKKSTTVAPSQSPEMTPEELAEYKKKVSQLDGKQPDFWEGEQWNWLGFVIQYMWVFGFVVAIIACLVAVRTYNLGATDFKNTEVFKEAIESQASGSFGESFIESPASGDSVENAPSVQE